MRSSDILLLQLEIPAAVVREALKAAARCSIISILNLAPVTEQARELARLANIIVANESEFMHLASVPKIIPAALSSELKRVSQEYQATVIVTLGEKGVAYFHDGAFGHVASPKITPVDTVGAGDTFCGYLAALLEEGQGLARAISLSAHAASLACLTGGAQSAIPFRSSVLSAFNKH